MRRIKVLQFGLSILTACVTLQGCAAPGSQICRPDPLIHPEIRFDETAHRNLFEDHVYFSKEASGGGQGLGGGGCGCN